MIRSIGIIGYGDFGRFLETLTGRFLPTCKVKIYSRSKPIDSSLFFPLEDVCQCDVVVLTVPISVFSERLADVVPHLGENSVVVDVATVKEHTTKALAPYAGRIRYVASHPMFGPFSYEKKGGSLEGLRLVISAHTLLDDEMAVVEEFLRGLGLVILHLSPESHDRMLAETLFLTHFLAQGVVKGDFKRTQIDTVSFGFLMDAVESVKHDTALFLDVYRYNRYCKDIPARMCEALEQVATDLKTANNKIAD